MLGTLCSIRNQPVCSYFHSILYNSFFTIILNLSNRNIPFTSRFFCSHKSIHRRSSSSNILKQAIYLQYYIFIGETSIRLNEIRYKTNKNFKKIQINKPGRMTILPNIFSAHCSNSMLHYLHH